MHDIKEIRKDPDLFAKKISERNFKIDLKLENEFNFIKAKFLGFSSEKESDYKKYLTQTLHNYSEAILHSKKGDLITVIIDYN